jgi:hypothetical protein
VKKKPKTAAHLKQKNAEYQAAFRAKRDARLHELETFVAALPEAVTSPLRKNGTPGAAPLRKDDGPAVTSLRKTRPDDEEDSVATNTKKGNEVCATFTALAAKPGLTEAELATILSRYKEWTRQIQTLTPSRTRYESAAKLRRSTR